MSWTLLAGGITGTKQKILKLSLCFEFLRRVVTSSSRLSLSLFGLPLSYPKSLLKVWIGFELWRTWAGFYNINEKIIK